jgi:hypothetical protein
MEARAEDFAKSFQSFRREIYEWRFLRSVVMTSGVVVGHKSCSIALQVRANSMAMQSAIYYLPRFGIATKILSQDLIA